MKNCCMLWYAAAYAAEKPLLYMYLFYIFSIIAMMYAATCSCCMLRHAVSS